MNRILNIIRQIKSGTPKPVPANRPKNLAPDEAARLLNAYHEGQHTIQVLDVRTPEEYAAGHIHQAWNINFFDPQFQQKLVKLDKSKPYLVHCASGQRSVKAREILTKLGFTHLYHLEGGLKAWQKAGYPVEH